LISVHHYLIVSLFLFATGLYGIMMGRNVIMILLSVELILNAANLSFVAFSSAMGNLDGQIVVFFTMIVAAVEVTVGLAIVVILYRKKNTIQVDELKKLKW
jgi:NADH-quinone oxidoreductase subunit K